MLPFHHFSFFLFLSLKYTNRHSSMYNNFKNNSIIFLPGKDVNYTSETIQSHNSCTLQNLSRIKAFKYLQINPRTNTQQSSYSSWSLQTCNTIRILEDFMFLVPLSNRNRQERATLPINSLSPQTNAKKKKMEVRRTLLFWLK